MKAHDEEIMNIISFCLGCLFTFCKHKQRKQYGYQVKALELGVKNILFVGFQAANILFAFTNPLFLGSYKTIVILWSLIVKSPS